MAGQLFKTLAVALSDRISEASSKMRTEVVAKNAKKQEQKTLAPSHQPAQPSREPAHTSAESSKP